MSTAQQESFWTYFPFYLNLPAISRFYCNTVEIYGTMFKLANQRHLEISRDATSKMASIIRDYAQK